MAQVDRLCPLSLPAALHSVDQKEAHTKNSCCLIPLKAIQTRPFVFSLVDDQTSTLRL